MMLYLIRGLPGSGKSTLARSMPYIHFEADQYFMVNGKYEFDRSTLPEAHAWCLRETETALRNGHNVSVANTFTTYAEMQPYLDLAKSLGIKPCVVTCKGGFGSIHNVPESAIQRMRDRWED